MEQLKPLIPDDNEKGLIAWMVNNRVTPNIIMLVFIIGGLFVSTKIKQELFPEFDLDFVQISVAYPGSSPEEIEQGIILAVEEAVRGLDGVKEIISTASESSSQIWIELAEDAKTQRTYQDIKQKIDAITTFPEDAEEPRVSLLTHKRSVLAIQLYGDVSEWVLREMAEQTRDRLLQNKQITQIELQGARAYEVQAEVSQDTLRAYGLTLSGIAEKIRNTSVELGGGFIDTKSGEILLRVKQRRDWADEFARIPIVSTPEGTILYLSDIAKVTDGFEDSDRLGTYNGKRSIGISVYRTGRQTPIGVSKATRAVMRQIEKDLPDNVHWAIHKDRSKMYKQRLQLLLKNACFGLILVMLLLTLFLEYKLAFWVMLGIPTSFLGAILLLPQISVTINMVSMFAFIIALGIVVDDAIVAGENIYEYRNLGMNSVKAAINGARDVAVPVSFSIITNIIAFVPMCFVPGVMGKFFKIIPLVVITIFSISWVESLLILPSHLAHSDPSKGGRLSKAIHQRQQKIGAALTRFIKNVYGPFLDKCIRHRYVTVSIGIAILIVVFGYISSGRIGTILMPKVEANEAVVTATLPFGSALEKSSIVRDKLVAIANDVISENGGDQLAEGLFALINENVVEVTIYLTDAGTRPIGTTAVIKLWRKKIGQLVGLESLKFESNRGGPASGADLTVELSHRDIIVLENASQKLAEILSEFPNITDIDDGYSPGKRQMDFSLKPEGESLGLTAHSVARQVRNAFYGAEALRQQRGRNEIRVKVRFPKNQRTSEADIEQLLIRTPSGSDVPLMEIADFDLGRAYRAIERRNARRTVTVTANVEPVSKTSLVIATLNAEILPQLTKDFPGLSYGYEGQQADFGESMGSLLNGLVLALMGIFVMLAIPFRSYSQPLIVMVAVPFGIIGAVIGHIIMGYSLSIMSLMGIVALVGVVVNDSLVLINYYNKLKDHGIAPHEAIHQAGTRRFRAIILTSLTTFGGLTPMIFETSLQARFLIPMAISLGYGILFSTVITLILVPSLSMILEDAHSGMAGFKLSCRDKVFSIFKK
ncbi:MAG: efflux RND transporter permease subunit [Anaerohalosphaeraceae bacterium]|nr:efflux RND transporter permease subunit [Anaerohalosphaeraceae bacterium]